jgi:hypothetical protein
MQLAAALIQGEYDSTSRFKAKGFEQRKYRKADQVLPVVFT